MARIRNLGGTGECASHARAGFDLKDPLAQEPLDAPREKLDVPPLLPLLHRGYHMVVCRGQDQDQNSNQSAGRATGVGRKKKDERTEFRALAESVLGCP